MLRICLTVLITIACLTSSRNLAAVTPYSVEAALLREQIGDVEFGRSGRYLIVARMIPAAAASQYSWSSDAAFANIGRSRLFLVDLEQYGGLQPLFGQSLREGYKPLSISPDGRYLAYLHEHQTSITVGVYDLRTARDSEFPFTPAADGISPAWISNTELISSETSSRRTSVAYTDQIAEAWGTMSKGQGTTASAVGSGQYAAKWIDDQERGLLVANAITGTVRHLARGLFSYYAISPDGRRVAAARVAPSLPDPNVPLGQNQYQRRQLVIFSLDAIEAEPRVCAPCELAPMASLDWSPSGETLVFSNQAPSAANHPLWTYDLNREEAHPLDLQGLILVDNEGRESRGEDSQFAWVGEHLVVAAMGTGKKPGRSRAMGWYSLSGAGPLNLTAGFGHSRIEVVGVKHESLFVLADNEIWAVNSDCTRRRISKRFNGIVRVWREGETSTLSTLSGPTSTIILEEVRAADKTKFVHLLNVESGKMITVKAPAANAEIVAVSETHPRVAFKYLVDNTEALTVAARDAGAREVMRLNGHLTDTVGGTPVSIRHTGPKGEPVTSWLLLPPGYRTGDLVPTVVDIYPGRDDGGSPGGLRFPDPETSAGQENAQLLAAHGYAVLRVSMPTTDMKVPREAMRGVTDVALSAVDAASRAGYIDDKRVAIQGESFGAFATVAVICKTHRFKGAIAAAGMYDLLSFYGVPRIGKRLEEQYEGLDLGMPVGWVETGQGGLGVPPWRDPERYLRESPLLHVESIDTPLMLIHGDLDSTVPFSQSEEMFTALYRLKKDAVFVRYWGEGHGVTLSPENIRDYYRRVFAWYDEHIGPPFPVEEALRSRKIGEVKP